jgi:hypothetical protein
MKVKALREYLATLPDDLPVTVMQMGMSGIDMSVKHANRMVSKDKSYDRVILVPMGSHLNKHDETNDEISGAS